MSESTESSDELGKKVKAITGLETTSVFDHVRAHRSDKHSEILIEVYSNDQREEDVSQMEKTKTVLEKKEHEDIVRSAFVDVLLEVGQAIPKTKLERLFPGLDINDPDFSSQYDFKSARIRVQVLSSESYELLKETLYPGKKDNKSSGGFTSPEIKRSLPNNVSSEIDLNLSEKQIIYVKEVQPPVKNKLEKKGALDRRLSEQERDLIKTYLKTSIIHELIHVLDIATEMPVPFGEGITEWYAQRIINRDLADFFIPNKTESTYELETAGVSILMIAMIENGFGLEQIDKAFVGQDEKEQEKIIKFLRSRYGEKEAMRIINWDFQGSRESFNFIRDLEIKIGSDYGNLSRIVHKGKGRR